MSAYPSALILKEEISLLRNMPFRNKSLPLVKKKAVIGSQLLIFGFAAATFAIGPVAAQADTIDFGGRSERFKGRGDRVPPKCQVQAPSAAGGSFLILWNCEDDDTEPNDIRSELWVMRKGSSAWQIANQVLGFPAAQTVDETLLKSLDVKAGLPATFRVVGIDRAGNATISTPIVVNPGDASSMTCSLTVATSGTETSSDGSTTGVPSRTVSVTDAPSEAIAATATAVTLKSSGVTLASTCEIDSICDNESLVSFSGSGVVNDGSSSDISLSILPGGVNVNLSGTITNGSDGTSVASASLSGTTTIEEETATVSLECTSTTASTESDIGVTAEAATFDPNDTDGIPDLAPSNLDGNSSGLAPEGEIIPAL